jgi:AcrR family transcriptional regulator
MEKRAAAVDETRRRIVAATIASHDENESIVDTGVDEIALRADVAPATVRRHFPTRDELVTACGQHVLVELGLPSPAAAGDLFGDARSPEDRLARLVDALCDAYARGELRLDVAHREAPRVAALRGFLSHLDSVREQLVRKALGAVNDSDERVGIASGLVAFPVWKAIRDAGVAPENVQEALRRAVGCAASARTYDGKPQRRST